MIEAPVSSAISCKPAQRLLHRRERGVGDVADEHLVLAAGEQIRGPAVRVDMGQQNALVRVGELGRQRNGVTRALGAVDADDQWGGLGVHDGSDSPVRPPGIDGVVHASARGGYPTASRMGW